MELLQPPAGTAALDQGVAGGSGDAAAPQAASGAAGFPLARESAPAGNLAGSEAGRSGTMAAQGAAMRRSLRRLSSFDVNKTEPGTMLVRVRSGRGGEEGGTPTFRRSHRRWAGYCSVCLHTWVGFAAMSSAQAFTITAKVAT